MRRGDKGIKMINVVAKAVWQLEMILFSVLSWLSRHGARRMMHERIRVAEAVLSLVASFLGTCQKIVGKPLDMRY